MTKYVDILIEQHVEIKDLLSNIHIYLTDSESKLKFISKFSKLVSQHIVAEDKELYVVLEKEAKINLELKNKLQIFAKRWTEVSEFANYYITKYSSINFDNKEFLIDTGKMLAKLKTRMTNEEIQLFTEYKIIKEK